MYVLVGEVTVLEGADEYVLGAGDAATFPSGIPVYATGAAPLRIA